MLLVDCGVPSRATKLTEREIDERACCADFFYLILVKDACNGLNETATDSCESQLSSGVPLSS